MSTKNDRHSPTLRQYNVRVPQDLMAAFNQACKGQGVLPAQVIRTLMQGFVDVAAESGGATPGGATP